ncbi:FHA domain-containing protein [Sorangium sp. So ce321]|uniref:FHA domain-containing protein n=1 Tax=Sorangium sp. So ce321 TaxID=3133300 RepID=UPI003F630EBA
MFQRALELRLSPLERQGVLVIDAESRLLGGDVVIGTLVQQLSDADVAVFLLSADLLADALFTEHLVPRALTRHRSRSLRLVPVLIRPVDYSMSPFADLRPLPSNGVPISRWSDQDDAWLDVVTGLRRIMDAPRQGSAPSLVIEDGPLQGQTLVLEAGRTYVLGRDARAHLQLPDDDPKASRSHALIDVTSSAIIARDLQSKNGIYVNERRVTTAVLQPDDRLRIGRTSLRISIPGYEAPATPEVTAATETDSAIGAPPSEDQDSTTIAKTAPAS